jgi:hypothetical protein
LATTCNKGGDWLFEDTFRAGHGVGRSVPSDRLPQSQRGGLERRFGLVVVIRPIKNLQATHGAKYELIVWENREAPREEVPQREG